MQSMGVPVIDTTMVTQSMWEAASDGIHYLQGNGDNWYGSIGTAVVQV